MKSGLLDRINAKLRGFPAGPAVVDAHEQRFGHDDDLYVPAEYGNYLVTSNEVFSAAMLRARLVSSVPLRTYRGSGRDKSELPTSPAAALLRHINPFWTWARLSRMDELAMCIWGETYWAVERDNAGVPRELWWLKPSRVTPVPHPGNYLAGFLYRSVNGEEIPFTPDQIIWQRYPNPLDEYSALSPISGARLAADTGSAMMTAHRNLHTQGLQIAGMVMPKQRDGMAVQFSAAQAEELEDRLQKRFAGVDKAHRWAVLRYEAEVHPVSVTPKDAEFLGGLNLTLRQVANAYGIPAPLLNDLEHATLANLREFQRALWEHALVPDLGLRAQEIEEQLLPMFGKRTGAPNPDHVEYDFSAVAALQESQTEAWDRERQAIQSGCITVNEWRAKHGMPPVKWGDVWFAGTNLAPVKDAEGIAVPEPPPALPPADDVVVTDEDERAFLAALNGHRSWELT